MQENKCVLAYSGGLDTSAIVPWLIDQGCEVHAVLVDVGQCEDLEALSEKALVLGATTAVIRDAKAEMTATAVSMSLALAATYEGAYRLGTALARPFIALEQVRRAKELGGATLVHGATGKGNDQIRFEFAYRALAPAYKVLAPWKVWEFSGRRDLIDYLNGKGFGFEFELEKDYSLDENLWHLSVEGGGFEEPAAQLDLEKALASVAHRFGVNGTVGKQSDSIVIEFEAGIPVALNGETLSLQALLSRLNADFRHADWAYDLVIENRMTGIKSRGLYINPAAKLVYWAVDALARSCLNKPTYDLYVEWGRKYGELLYGGEYFSDQRVAIEAAACGVISRLNGEVTIRLQPTPYVSRIAAADAIFSRDLATFEQSRYSHADAHGFIQLSWLSRVGRPYHLENGDENALEGRSAPSSGLREVQPVARTGLVPASA